MFRTIDEMILVSPQIDTRAVAEAKALGVTLIINNRPEGESEDQVPGDEIEAAARAAGIGYVAIPISHAGFSQSQVSAMTAALEGSHGRVLAYCRSGTRSTLLWALAQSSCGANPDILSEKAATAGYDLAPVRALMDVLRAKS